MATIIFGKGYMVTPIVELIEDCPCSICIYSEVQDETRKTVVRFAGIDGETVELCMEHMRQLYRALK